MPGNLPTLYQAGLLSPAGIPDRRQELDHTDFPGDMHVHFMTLMRISSVALPTSHACMNPRKNITRGAILRHPCNRTNC